MQRSPRRAREVKIPGVMHEVGKESVLFKGPVIWNVLNRIVNINSSETTKKDYFT